MLKKFLVFATVCISALLVSSCGKGDKAAKTFTVGFDASFPPYGFIGEDGAYIGFDLDLAQEVCNRNGWTLVKKPVEWAAKDAELNAGTIDCIWNGFTMSEERKTLYTWSEPYVQNSQLILVRADSGITEFAQLKDKSVVVQDGSSGATAFEDKLTEVRKADPSFALKAYKRVPDYNTAYTMLDSKAIDAIGLDSAVAKGFVEKSQGKFVILAQPLASEEFGIGFKLGNTALRDQVQATLKAMVADGTCQKILDKWKTEHAKDGGDGIDFILK
jgi:polar amino acid transport system substrate-binding protein